LFFVVFIVLSTCTNEHGQSVLRWLLAGPPPPPVSFACQPLWFYLPKITHRISFSPFPWSLAVAYRPSVLPRKPPSPPLMPDICRNLCHPLFVPRMEPDDVAVIAPFPRIPAVHRDQGIFFPSGLASPRTPPLRESGDRGCMTLEG